MRLLEKQIKQMASLHEALNTQVGELTKENSALKARLAKLAVRERVQQRFGGGGKISSPASSAQSQAGSMPGLGAISPLSTPIFDESSSASGGSVFSAPATPAEDDAAACPQAKKMKVASYGGPASTTGPTSTAGTGAGRGGFNARTGLLLFSLVMSVGLFYNMVGVHDLASTGAVVETMDDSSSVTVPTQATAALVTMAPRGRALQSVSAGEEDTDAFALVPLSDRTQTDRDVADTSSRELDVYTQDVHRPASHQLARSNNAVQSLGIDLDLGLRGQKDHLRALLQAGNLTHSPDQKYIFAPQAMRITQRVWEGIVQGEGDDEVPSTDEANSIALFDRARARGTKRPRDSAAAGTKKSTPQERLRARLPAPDDASAAAAEESVAPLNVGDKLLLWVPLSTVAPGLHTRQEQDRDEQHEHAQQHSHPHSHHQQRNDSVQQQGLVEIACHIAHVRPIVLS